jgi:hypothetical protein
MCRDDKWVGKVHQGNIYRSQLGEYCGPSEYVDMKTVWVKWIKEMCRDHKWEAKVNKQMCRDNWVGKPDQGNV